MGLLESLRDGALGVEMAFPPTIEAVGAEERSFQFVGPRSDVGWWVFFFPKISLDLSDAGWPTLERDIRRQTRALFEQMFRGRGGTPERALAGPRTKDATWSPLVEVERFSVEGGSALYVLHRMTYERGSEILMGHLLVPCADGLLEMRWVTKETKATGLRESVWVVKNKAIDHPGQKVFDDPALDADFPDHPLSTARAARRWLAQEVPVRVLEPAWQDTRATIELPAIGCLLVPPPRFGQPSIGSGLRGRSQAAMNRASFSGTDGVDWFFVQTLATPLRFKFGSTERLLGKEVEKLAREMYTLAGVQRIRSEMVATDAGKGRVTASVIVDGDGHLEPLRMVVHGTAADDRIVSLFLTTSATLSTAEMLAEVRASAESLRRI